MSHPQLSSLTRQCRFLQTFFEHGIDAMFRDPQMLSDSVVTPSGMKTSTSTSTSSFTPLFHPSFVAALRAALESLLRAHLPSAIHVLIQPGFPYLSPSPRSHLGSPTVAPDDHFVAAVLSYYSIPLPSALSLLRDEKITRGPVPSLLQLHVLCPHIPMVVLQALRSYLANTASV